jgi:hypothetical protein
MQDNLKDLHEVMKNANASQKDWQTFADIDYSLAVSTSVLHQASVNSLSKETIALRVEKMNQQRNQLFEVIKGLDSAHSEGAK